MLSELLRFDPDAGASLQRLQPDWYGLFLASELLEAGVRDASIVAYAEQACAATARSISADGTDQRERCMAAVAAVRALNSDPLVALQQHRAEFGNNLLAQGARSRALAELASSHISQALMLFEHSIVDEDDLGTLFTLTETAKTWWQYLIARPYARMFHPRRISVAEARGLCEEMQAGLDGLPSSAEHAEHVALYRLILDRLNGGGRLLPQPEPRTGLIASSHRLALEMLAQADAGLDKSGLQRLLHDRRGWLHSINRGIGESHLSFGSGVYLLYIFPAVRLASLVAGRQIGQVADPASTFMRLRIAGQDLVHKTRSRFGYVPEPTASQLRELLEPLLEFVQTVPVDERVWATIGDLRLRLEQFEEAKGALTTALSFDWSDRITRKGALYDLACTYARMGQEQDCRIALTEWTNMGTHTNEREHVMKVSDLKSVRNSRWFRDLFEQAT